MRVKIGHEAVHTAPPLTLRSPFSHDLQDVAPMISLYVPAAQGEQLAVAVLTIEGARYVPRTQGSLVDDVQLTLKWNPLVSPEM